MYDFVQNAMGFRRSYARLQPIFARTQPGETVLEVGAGTGLWASLVPSGSRYIWLDMDWQKLGGFRARYPDALTVFGDGSQLPFRDNGADTLLVVGVLHHVPEASLDALVSELARIANRRLVVLDPVWVPGRWLSKLLWRYDRGSYPRTAQRLRAVLSEHFELEEVQEYAVYHRYFLCVARPRMSSPALLAERSAVAAV